MSHQLKQSIDAALAKAQQLAADQQAFDAAAQAKDSAANALGASKAAADAATGQLVADLPPNKPFWADQANNIVVTKIDGVPTFEAIGDPAAVTIPDADDAATTGTGTDTGTTATPTPLTSATLTQSPGADPGPNPPQPPPPAS